MTLRLIADDLTGALDASAPFATTDSPVRILLSERPETGNKLAFSTESRALPEDEARARVAAAVDRLRPGSDRQTLWFKKVDSVLRGHSLAETLVMARAGDFERCLFAPAFPEMGRITRAGRHLVRNSDGSWRETPHGDLRDAFIRMMGNTAPHLDLVVPDAETPAQLRDACSAWRDLPRTLWAGSRGLAQALSASSAELTPPRFGLFVLGTTHQATRAQARELTGRLRPMPSEGPIFLSGSAPLLLDPVPFCRDGAATKDTIARAIRRLQPPGDDSAIFVTGGDSLSVFLDVLGAQAVECLGEIAKGLPLARIVDGRMAGVMIVTKSGGFGDANLLRSLL